MQSDLPPQIYLASGSPRRRELLTQIGVRFAVIAQHVPETMLPGEAPRDYAQRLALEKALAGWRTMGACRRPVLGADTIVVVDDQVLGKPRDRADGLAMLALLSGRSHQVYSAVALVGQNVGQNVGQSFAQNFAQYLAPNGAQNGAQNGTHNGTHNGTQDIAPMVGPDDLRQDRRRVLCSESRVWFRALSVAEREAYWASGEPADKAGAYAIQGRAALFIQRLEGSYSAVMGLPLFETGELLAGCGIEIGMASGV